MRRVDSIARLGRMGNTIAQVEESTARSLMSAAKDPLLGATLRREGYDQDRPVFTHETGYIEDVDLSYLQECAEECGGMIHIAATPGFVCWPGTPGRLYRRRRGDYQ